MQTGRSSALLCMGLTPAIHALAIGGSGQDSGRFDRPAGVPVDSGHRAWVAVMFNATMAIFQFLGSGK